MKFGLAAASAPPLVLSKAEDEAAPADRQAWAQVLVCCCWDRVGIGLSVCAAQVQVRALPVCCEVCA